MNELSFRIEYRPHSRNCELPWLIDEHGVERQATNEEAQMYALLQRHAEQEEQAQHAEQEEQAQHGRKRK